MMAWTIIIGAILIGIISIASSILDWSKWWRLVWQRVDMNLPENTPEKITKIAHGIGGIFMLGIGIHGVLENIFTVQSYWTIAVGITIALIIWILVFTQYRRITTRN